MSETDKIEAEKTASKTEGGKKKTYICPKCGQEVEAFYKYGNAPNPICPKCGRIVSIRDVPEEAVVVLPAKRKKEKKKSKRQVSTEMVVEKEEETEIGLFRKPKEPHEILREVLTQFGVKEEFIKFMVQRSKRIGGIHPMELNKFLLAMQSGVRNKELANLITNEYYLALQSEQRKAQELGINMSYPLSIQPTGFGSESTYPTMGLGFEQRRQYPMGVMSQPRQPAMGFGQQTFFNPEALKRELLSTVKNLLKEREEKREIDMVKEQLQHTREQIIKMQSEFQGALKDIVNALTDKLKDIAEKAKEPPPNVMTKDEFEKFTLKQQLDIFQKLLEEKDRRIQEIIQQMKEDRKEMTESLQKILEQYEAERAELLKKIEEVSSRQPVSVGEFQTDEAKVVTTALNRVADILERKSPIEIIVKSLPHLLGPTGTITQERPKYVETKESESNITSMLPREYIAEE